MHEASLSTDKALLTDVAPSKELPSPMPGRLSPKSTMWQRWLRRLYIWFVEPFVSSQNPPWFDARAVGIGFVVGFGIPVGGQCAAMALARVFIRYNVAIAFAVSFVTNPFTMIPMYYAYYYVGSLILGLEPTFTLEGFRLLMKPILNAGYFYESFGAFVSLSFDVLKRWFVTAAILASIFGPLGYLASYHYQINKCRRRAEKLGMTYEKLLKDLEESLLNGKRHHE